MAGLLVSSKINENSNTDKNKVSLSLFLRALLLVPASHKMMRKAQKWSSARMGGQCGNRRSEQRGPCGGSGFFWKRFARRRGRRQSRGVKVIFATGFPSFLRAALGETTTSQTWEEKENIGLSYQKVNDENSSFCTWWADMF